MNTIAGNLSFRIMWLAGLFAMLFAVMSSAAYAGTASQQVEQRRLPADEVGEHSRNLRDLMVSLYKLSPDELHKSTSVSAEEFSQWVFEGPFGWKFDAIRKLQGIDALSLVFSDEYRGDRVLPLIVGLHTMLVKAYGGETEFRFTHEPDARGLYNAARNVDIAAWKLFNARDVYGKAYIEPHMDADIKKMTELMHLLEEVAMRTLSYADALAGEKSQRSGTDLSQGVFIP
jgi:hypothetical protein